MHLLQEAEKQFSAGEFFLTTGKELVTAKIAASKLTENLFLKTVWRTEKIEKIKMVEASNFDNYYHHTCSNKKFQDVVRKLHDAFRLNHLSNVNCVLKSFQHFLTHKNIIFELFVKITGE